MRLLLVEDEKYMAEAVEFVLKKNNYTVDLVFDGESGFDYAMSNIYDVIILDIMLPNIDGITVLKKLREHGIKTPIIMLTAKGEINDKVLGLDSGADDYLLKPFQTDELMARLRALTRRKSDINNNNILKYEDIKLNPNNLTIYYNEKNFRLTLKESQTLELLISTPEKVISKENIIEKLWGYEEDISDNAVEVYISFLRKKLSSLGTKTIIETVRGIGYKITALKEE
jgi:DNA-binding response OmpR family regulator